MSIRSIQILKDLSLSPSHILNHHFANSAALTNIPEVGWGKLYLDCHLCHHPQHPIQTLLTVVKKKKCLPQTSSTAANQGRKRGGEEPAPNRAPLSGPIPLKPPL